LVPLATFPYCGAGQWLMKRQTPSYPSSSFYLDASTAHLTKKTRALLTKMAGDPMADWTVASTGYGWFVNCPDEPETFEPPMDLLAVWRFAALHGCQGVLFDEDATVIPDLPYALA
jgi:hypothetical protein